MTVEDLLDWVDRRVMNGALTTERSSAVRAFVFEGGYLIGMSSNQPGDHLGALLVHRGLIDEGELGRLLEVHEDMGISLGRLAIDTGKVSEESLREVLQEQAQEALLDVWTWPDGIFRFEPAGEQPAEVELRLALRLRTCIVAGRQRTLRWKQLRRIIPRDDLVLVVADAARLAAVEAEAAELAAAARQRQAIAELVAQQVGRRFLVLERLAPLVEQGILAVVEQGQAAAAQAAVPAEELAQAARQKLAQGDLGTALDVARQALALESSNPAIQAMHQDVERAMFAELSRELLATFRVPRLVVERERLDSLGLTEAERYLAGRVDGRWDLLSLMRASRLRHVEALITFKRLADRGIISL